MSEYTLPELLLGEGEFLAASLISAGLSCDLSIWNITIHKHGLLTQTIRLMQPPDFNEHVAVLRSHVPDDCLRELKNMVANDGFMGLGDTYTAAASDQRDTKLIARSHGVEKCVYAYGPRAIMELAESEQERRDATIYCRLWDAIVGLSPFRPYRRQ